MNTSELNAHHFGRKRIGLIVLFSTILLLLEIYAQTYVQIHSISVVSEQAVQMKFSNPLYYTGSLAFSESGCQWLVGWLIRRPAPQNAYVTIFKTEENKSLFSLGTDLVILDLRATSNNTNYFSAHMDQIDYGSNYTAIRIIYDLGQAGTYQVNFDLHTRVYERTPLGLIPHEDVTIPINATVHYGP